MKWFRIDMKILDQDILINLNLKKKKDAKESLYGVKSKCTLNIVPKDNKSESFNMNKKCIIKRKKLVFTTSHYSIVNFFNFFFS